MRFSTLSPLAVLSLFTLAGAQSSTSASTTAPSSTTPSPSISLSLTTASVTVTIATRSGNQPIQVTSVIPVVSNVTRTLTPTSSSSSSTPQSTSDTSASATPTPELIVLDTKLDPAFGVLGAILIITGLPSAFWGHKNRWTSFFLIGFYTLSLVCAVLIIKFGVLPAVNPPSKTLRGMFVLSSSIAGIAGGAIAIFFWKGARYGIGAWGGLALALWIQCFQNGGVIKAIGFRWILYIGCAVIGFTLCTIPKIHYHILLISTAIVGSSAFMLGVDCYTTAGLKEFYIWNLGFPSLFPKFTKNGIQFPVTQTMQIELGLIGAVALMGTAVQLRILKVLQRKLQEIQAESRKRDEEAELHASDRFKEVERERDAWEKDHPTLPGYGRKESGFSMMPLMKHRDGSASPSAERQSSYTLADEGRTRHLSGVSDFKVAPTPDEELTRASRYMQSPGVLPTLDLGLGIQEDVPSNFIAKPGDPSRTVDLSAADMEDLKRKEELLAEIQTIRRSLDILKAETPGPASSSSDQSRRPSVTSRRTLSMDAQSALLPTSAHARPPRETDPRARVQSMELSTLARNSPLQGEPISRPTSVPLRDEDWDTYIQERKLLQPPAGVTPPILTTPSSRIAIPPAVHEALNKRKKRESAFGFASPGTESSEDVPLAKVAREKRTSPTGPAPVTILPPRRSALPIAAPTPQLPASTRTRTFEELNERHREKMRDMQAPLTEAERQHAEVEAARQRWERSKALEKEAVTKRQAEKVAALEKRKKSEDASPDGEGARRSMGEPRPSGRHSRSLSADKMGSIGMSSKRLSTLKVEDWQRYQQDTELTKRPEPGASGFKRESRALRSDGVPFPDTGAKGSYSRRMSRDYLS
ncbi:hypothetical protein BDQ12DRAFT_226099 [Crucibulum laeve]|uniref:TM7S3/TM198-like domain-containing protein n=1 Tax=Crucibulum laeve TaxID=68775 RepID=A0A5C3LY50_9AGAR|nr:hypothetical protein BDQ12DRAFT_226099 [Crucibulum laeve]